VWLSATPVLAISGIESPTTVKAGGCQVSTNRQALEGIAHVEIPPRAAWLRALYLEVERVANHLGDLGALGNAGSDRRHPVRRVSRHASARDLTLLSHR
jgi:hypothetical protein